MKKIIFVSKKTEEQFVNAEEHIAVSLNGDIKTMITLSREDGSTKEVSESTFKRWYKKVEITIEEVTIKPRKGHRTTKFNRSTKVEDIKAGSFIGFYPTPKMKIQNISEEAAREVFGEFTLNRDTAFLTIEGELKPRRAYVNTETGNVGIRFHNQLFEIVGLKAYV